MCPKINYAIEISFFLQLFIKASLLSLVFVLVQLVQPFSFAFLDLKFSNPNILATRDRHFCVDIVNFEHVI